MRQHQPAMSFEARSKSNSAPNPSSDHGAHTLRTWKGTIVGIYGNDVFVELGPRMQGVIELRRFCNENDPPAIDQQHEFTLRGKEGSLWALALVGSSDLSSWENMEVGSWVEARVQRVVPGGLQLKAGKLHAFMPQSQCGLPRAQGLRPLLGKTLTCEVIEVDAERERVVLSRKCVLRATRSQKTHGSLPLVRVGQCVTGRVTRIEGFGLFIRFGRGQEGFIHVANLRHEHTDDPGELFNIGDNVDAQVLYIRQRGKRIGLGIKQLTQDPWRRLAKDHGPDAIVEGTTISVSQHGALIELEPGVVGRLPHAECHPRGQNHTAQIRVGQPLPVRLVEICPILKRAKLSLFRRDGGRIDPFDLETEDSDPLGFERFRRSSSKALNNALDGPRGGGRGLDAPLGTNLGDLLRNALGGATS